MSSTGLSRKSCRRLERKTGLHIERGWSNGYRWGAFTHVVEADGTRWVVDPRTGHFATVHEVRALEDAFRRLQQIRKAAGIQRLKDGARRWGIEVEE